MPPRYLPLTVRTHTIVRLAVVGTTCGGRYTIAAISVVLALAGLREASAQPQAGEVLALSRQCAGQIGRREETAEAGRCSPCRGRPSKWRPVRS